MFRPRLHEVLLQTRQEKEGPASSIRERIGAGEEGGPGEKLDERFVHWLWQGQRFAVQALVTLAGEMVRVTFPGWRSWQGGPDFKQAVIQIGKGARLKGDVEVHVHSSDWASHGHSRDPRYSDVILHVVFRSNRGIDGARTAENRPLPEVELSRFLEEGVGFLHRDFLAEGYPPRIPFPPGLCCSALEDKADERIATLLDWAGDERVCWKGVRGEKEVATDGYDEVLYRGLLEALGYKANPTAFRRLAGAVSWRELKGMDALTLQAVLLNLGGLLTGIEENAPPWDGATGLYLRRLEERWGAVSGRLHRRTVAGLQWSRTGWRPANNPVRRLVGLSHFLASPRDSGELFSPFWKDLENLAARQIERRREILQTYQTWQERLASHQDPYWSTRYTLGGKILPRPLRLIGKEMASAMLVNVLIPLLLAHSRQSGRDEVEEALHRLYGVVPRQADNASLRFMRARLFGEKAKEKMALFTGSRRQQGLLHLYQHYCLPQEAECGECALPIVLRAL